MDKTITVSCSTDNSVALSAFSRAFAEMANNASYEITATATEFPTITDVAPPAPALPWDERIHASSRATNKDASWTLRRKPKDLDESQWAARIAEVTAELEALMAIPVQQPSVIDTLKTMITPAYGDNGYTAEDIAAADPSLPVVENGPFYWIHPESSCCGFVDTLDEIEQMIAKGDGCVEHVDYANYAAYKAEIDALPPVVVPTPPPVVMPPIIDSVQKPIVTDHVSIDTPLPPTIDLKVSLAAVESPLPPVTPPAAAAVTDFPGLMKWLTTNVNPTNKHLVDQVLKAQGLTALPQLNQRPDLIPAFVAALGATL